MKHNLTLVKLTAEQIARAKEANGSRKRITHALICGPYGQFFGTEKQCLRYFTVWDPAYGIEVLPGKFKAIFPNLFSKAVKTDTHEITDYESTPDLTDILIKANDGNQQRNAKIHGGVQLPDVEVRPTGTKNTVATGEKVQGIGCFLTIFVTVLLILIALVVC